MADTYQSKFTGAEIDERLEWAEGIDPHIIKQMNTETGIHGIRYWQEKLEYNDGEAWVEIETGGDGTCTVIDNLTSTSTTSALSAKQGKVLNDLVSTQIGSQTYTEDNYVTDGESTTASIDALDMAVKDVSDSIGHEHEFFAHVGDGNGKMHQVSHEWTTYTNDLSPKPTKTKKLGFQVFSGAVNFANIQVKNYAGDILYSDDFENYNDGDAPIGWSQTSAGSADYKIKADATVPGGKGKCLSRTSDGNYFNYAWLDADIIPDDFRFVFEFDIKHVSGTAFAGPMWYVSPPSGANIHPTSIYWGEEPSSYVSIFRDQFESVGTPSSDVFLKYMETKRVHGEWYHMKIIVDNYNVSFFRQVNPGDALFNFFNYVYGPSVVLLDTRCREGAFQPGSLEGIWVANNAVYADRIIKLTIDGDTVEMSFNRFMFAYGTAEYAARYHGVNYAQRTFWRYLHIPYNEYLAIELSLDFDTIEANEMTFSQIWYRVGSPLTKYNNYNIINKEQTVAPMVWVNLGEIEGTKGVLHSLYIQKECEFEAQMASLEGNMRITVDGVPIHINSGTEDIPFSSYYFEKGTFGSDFVGVDRVVKSLAPRFSFYRYFILDPICFNESIKIELQNGDYSQHPFNGDLDILSLLEIYTTNKVLDE